MSALQLYKLTAAAACEPCGRFRGALSLPRYDEQPFPASSLTRNSRNSRPVVHPREALDGAAQRVGDRAVRLAKRQPDRQARQRAQSAHWRRHGSRRRCARESAGRDVGVYSKVTAEPALDYRLPAPQTKQLFLVAMAPFGVVVE